VSESLVSIVRYQPEADSVRRAVDLCRGLDRLPAGGRVFVKPNIVFWTRAVPFPKWGVVTTSRVVEAVVRLLKEHGAGQITLGEGMVLPDPKDEATPAHAFDYLGYGRLRERYGVRAVNVLRQPFQKVALGDGVELSFNREALEADFLVSLPVLKTHAQSLVSLGTKNLKGLTDIASRKKCHGPDPAQDLNFHLARLADWLPPCLTVIDGIYSLELGPSFDGRARRNDLLIASADILSADLVGAACLGFEPARVPHLALMARRRGRPTDLSDVKVAGLPVREAAVPHQYSFAYTEDGSLPLALKQMGLSGLSYRQYDLTMCTYCSALNLVIISAITRAFKGRPFDDIEILTGKVMKASPGKKHTLLVGKCIYQANKDNPDINDLKAIKGCPPSPRRVVETLRELGIEVDPYPFEHLDEVPGWFMKRYRGRPEFDESFFRID